MGAQDQGPHRVRLPHTRGDEPNLAARSQVETRRLPHTRGDEPDADCRTSGDGLGLPNTRGDEPDDTMLLKGWVNVCPTRVGMNPASGRSLLPAIQFAPHAWG